MRISFCKRDQHTDLHADVRRKQTRNSVQTVYGPLGKVFVRASVWNIRISMKMQTSFAKRYSHFEDVCSYDECNKRSVAVWLLNAIALVIRLPYTAARGRRRLIKTWSSFEPHCTIGLNISIFRCRITVAYWYNVISRIYEFRWIEACSS